MTNKAKVDPHEPAILRTRAHQIRRTDPAGAAELNRLAREADEALERERVDEIRAACLRAVQAAYPSATAADVARVDEGRSKGAIALPGLKAKGREADRAIFLFLENPPV